VDGVKEYFCSVDVDFTLHPDTEVMDEVSYAGIKQYFVVQTYSFFVQSASSIRY